MAKSLKDILQGVKSSKKVTNDLGGYKPKAGDEENFAKKHEIEKHEDRVGNDDDVYNATNVKHSMEKETRHGHKKPKDEKVYEEKKTCNMTEAGQMCEVHGMADCAKGGKNVKVLKEKDPVNEAWYSEKGGERTFHKGQREAMRHAREIGGKYGATHGAQGMKASTALGWDAREKQGLGLGLTSKADKAKTAQKQKAAKKAGPWGLREASLPAVIKNTLPATKSNLPAVVKPKSTTKPGMSDKVKKTIGTGAVLGTGAAGYYSLPDDDDEDTKSNAPSSAKKDDFPPAGVWRDDDKKTTAAAPEKIPTDSIPVDHPKKEPEKKEPEEKKPESWWDKQSRMKGEIEDAKHEMRLKRIRAGEKDDDDAPKAKAADDSSGKKIADPVTMKVTTKKDDDVKLPDPMMDVVKRAAKMNKIWNDSKRSVNEALSKKADAGEWISDFVHSDNPKFKGKSKEKRKQMALAAYYAKQRNEEVEIEEEKQYIEVTNRHTGAKKHIEVHPSKAYAALNQYKKSGDKARIVSKSVKEEADLEEALKGKQHKIDKNKNGKIDAQDFKLLRKEEAVSEAVKTGNEGHGYHGEAYGAATSDDKMAEAGKAYAKAHSLVKQHAAEYLKDVKNPNKMVKHYLDSQYGRHLHGNEHDAGYVKKDFAHFKRKYKPEMHEEVEQIDEISKKTAYAAYADRANDDYSKDYGEKLHGMIKKKWGDKAGEDAEAHASARHFGRGGKSSGTDKLSGIWNRSSDKMRTTKSGKINKQDTKAKASEIKSRLGSHKKANLPEDLAVPLLGSMSGEKIGKTNLKKKVKKEQTGPDTPLTLPNMSVDVNTGRNV